MLLVDIFCFACPVHLLPRSSYRPSLTCEEMCSVVEVFWPHPPPTPAPSCRHGFRIQIWPIESPLPQPQWLLQPLACVLSQANEYPPQEYSTRNGSFLLLGLQTTELPLNLPTIQEVREERAWQHYLYT